MSRDLSQPTTRGLSDDNDETRGLLDTTQRGVSNFSGKVLTNVTARGLAGFTGRGMATTSSRDLGGFVGKDLSDDNDEIRVGKTIGNQAFPWIFPLWFSDIKPKGLTEPTVRSLT